MATCNRSLDAYKNALVKGRRVMKRSKIRFVGVLLLALLLVGCRSRNSATINTYTDPSFTKGSIKRIAVFPMANFRAAQGEARTLERQISQSIQRLDPGISVIGPSEATAAINEHGLADKWAEFLRNYTSSGIPNTELLFQIGDLLGVDAIIQGELVNVLQRDGDYALYLGLTTVTVRYSLFGTDSGLLLWEASSDARKETETPLESAPPLIDVILLAQEKINESLPF
ncbi:MAG TPA: hypothetical protein PKV93_11820 [Fervidobacterium sp.]|nr:hypothetical protein [Fervidobacterium sp.]